MGATVLNIHSSTEIEISVWLCEFKIKATVINEPRRTHHLLGSDPQKLGCREQIKLSNKFRVFLSHIRNSLIKSSFVTFIKKARLEFRGSFASDTQAELKYIVLEVDKAISQKLSKGTRFCFNSFAHTATTLESTFSVLTVRTVTTSAHLQGVRKGFDLCFISDCCIKEISKGKAWVVRF